MSEQEFDFLDYAEPKAEEKAAVIASLQSGDYSLSFSSISAFMLSPRAFIAYKVQERKTTPAMVLGEAVHCLLLESDQFYSRFHIAPQVSGSTKEGKAAWAAIYQALVIEAQLDHVQKQILQNDFETNGAPTIPVITEWARNTSGIMILKAADAEDAKFRARMLYQNRAVRSVLDRIHTTEIKCETEIAGVRFTGRIDALGDGLLADIKNMPDAGRDAATRAIWARRLHWQAYIYDKSQGGGNEYFVLAVDPAGETSVHCFSDRNLWAAERQLEKAVHYFKQAVTDSLFDPGIWDMSQDFWFRSDMNRHGINYL